MKLALFGYGGHAKEVALQIGKKITFFVDDQYQNDFAKPISEFDPSEYYMMVSVSDPKKRKQIVEKLPSETEFFSFIHPTSILMDKNILVDIGCFIGAYSILTTNISLGKHCILNRGNQIGHDCLIGDYFSAMPGSIISGNVQIGDCTYLGTNSSVKEKIKITDNVIIGANGVVVKDINESGTYVGVPSKKIK